MKIGKLLKAFFGKFCRKKRNEYMAGIPVNQFSVEATQLADGDFFGIDKALGGGVFQTQKINASKVSFKTGDCVFVDAIYGNDATGQRERPDRAFLTPNAARNAAQSGDTIFVLPGTYPGSMLNKDGVNWHFYNGATIDPGSGIWVMNDSSFEGGTNTPFTCKVTGQGKFLGGIWLFQPASSLIFSCDSLESPSRGLLIDQGGHFEFFGRRLSSRVVTVRVGPSSGTVFVTADEILTVGGSAGSTMLIDGSCWIRAREITSATSAAVEMFTIPADIRIEAKTIRTFGSGPPVLCTLSGGFAIIEGAKITANSVNPAPAIGLTVGVFASGFRLKDCTLVSSSASAIECSVPVSIELWSVILANAAPQGTVSITDDSVPSRYVVSGSVS